MPRPRLLRLLVVSLAVACSMLRDAQAASNETLLLGTSPDHGHAIARLADGSVVVAVQTNSFAVANAEILLQRTDAAGAVLFTKALSGTHGSAELSLEPTADGGFLLGSADDTSTGGTNLRITRLDAGGTILWSRVIATPSDDTALHSRLIELADSSIMVVASSRAPSGPANFYDGWISRLDPSGTAVWTRAIGTGLDDLLLDAELLPDGNVLAVGTRPNETSSSFAGWIVEIAPDGAIVSEWLLDGPLTDYLEDLVVLPDGGAVLGGYSDSWTLEEDHWIVRLDADRSVLWSVAVGSSEAEIGSLVQVLRNGHVLAGGNTLRASNGDDASLVELGPDGSLVAAWNRGGPGYDTLAQMLPPDTDGSVTWIGTLSEEPLTSPDAWIVRYDPAIGLDAGCPSMDAVAYSAVPAPVTVQRPASPVGVRPESPFASPFSARDVTLDPDVRCAAVAPVIFDADLKAGSCPNPLNLRARGTLPAALVGLQPGEAAGIDPASVTLEGVPALRCSLSDVTAPWDEAASGSCCGTPGTDGIDDLQCHFDRVAVAAALCASRVPPPEDGAVVDVVLRAVMRDGRTVTASDCARVTSFGCSGRALQSAPPRRTGR